MSEINIADSLEVTPRQAIRLIKRILNAGHVPCLLGPVGCAKTAIHQIVADDLNLQLLDIALPGRMLEDFTGFMNFTEDGRAEMVPLAGFIPMEGYDSVPEGKIGYLVFLDELANSDRPLKKACYKLLHQRLMGDRLIHSNALLAVASNRAEDGAAAEDLDNGLKTRVITLTVRPNLTEWMEDVAIPRKFDPRIIGMLSAYPSMLCKMDNVDSEVSAPNLRTWEAANNILSEAPKGALGVDDMILLNGCVGSEAASKLVAFSQVFDKIPSMQELMDGTKQIPQEGDLQWATMVMMLEYMESEEIAVAFQPAIMLMEPANRTLFMRMAMIRMPEIIELKEFAPLVKSIGIAAQEARI